MVGDRHTRTLEPRPRHLAARRAGLVLAGVLLALLAGCGVVRGTITTVTALDDAGFGVPDIQLDAADDGVRVRVEKDTEDLAAGAAEAAEVVWDNLPLRIERMEVTCTNGFGGRGTFEADRTELERRFGPRDPTLDEGLQDDDLRTLGIVVAAMVIGGLVVLAAIVILIVVLVRRSRRRNPPPGPPGPPSGWQAQPPPPGYRP